MGVKVIVLGSNLESLTALLALEVFDERKNVILVYNDTSDIVWSCSCTRQILAVSKYNSRVAISCKALLNGEVAAVESLKSRVNSLDSTRAGHTHSIITNQIFKALKTRPRDSVVLLEYCGVDVVPVYGLYSLLVYFGAASGSLGLRGVNAVDTEYLRFLCVPELSHSLHELEALVKCDSPFKKVLLAPLVWHGYGVGSTKTKTEYPLLANLSKESGKFALLGDFDAILNDRKPLDVFVYRFYAPWMWYRLVSHVRDRHWLLRTLVFQPSAPIPRHKMTDSTPLNDIFSKEIGKTFHALTAISYTNGLPHIGHTYEIIVTDVLCRFRRLFGNVVKCISGTDEHGIKVANTAEKQGMTPRALADYCSAKFRENNAMLHCQIDDFVRTTEPRHIKCAQKVWRTIQAKGDVYLGEYCGWYNEREETFVTETEAASTNYCDPLSGKPYLVMKEPSYFFRMAKYQKQLVDYIKANPSYISPESRRNEILTRLEEPLEDLSISRTQFGWGIPVPGDPSHVMYVWFDALSYYLTATDFHKDFPSWPPDILIFGKDIVWFHATILGCMLMSLGLPLPRVLYSHGFIVAADGRKMSKSLGNTIDLDSILSNFGPESLRYYLMRDSVLGHDVKFDPVALKDLHNADLADTIGNLVHRATSMTHKYCDGMIPEYSNTYDLDDPMDVERVLANTRDAINGYNIQAAVVACVEAFRNVNKYLTDAAPWVKTATSDYRRDVVRIILESVYLLAHLMQPTIPTAASHVFQKLNTPPRAHLGLLSLKFDNLEAGTRIEVGNILFVKQS